MDFRPNQLSFHFRSDYAIDGLRCGFGNSFLSLSLSFLLHNAKSSSSQKVCYEFCCLQITFPFLCFVNFICHSIVNFLLVTKMRHFTELLETHTHTSVHAHTNINSCACSKLINNFYVLSEFSSFRFQLHFQVQQLLQVLLSTTS